MKERWYESPVTWGCMALCAVLLALGLTMDRHTAQLPEDQNLRVLVGEDCGVYTLEVTQKRYSQGAMNADGSTMEAGQLFGWEVGTGPAPVTVTALDQARNVLFETTVTCDFTQGAYTLLLTDAGFAPMDAR